MSHKCEHCKDTGELGYLGFLDCTHCDAAQKRVALNRYAKSLGNMAETDFAWAIYQYAVKQESKENGK